jgi:hypothetical protein
LAASDVTAHRVSVSALEIDRTFRKAMESREITGIARVVAGDQMFEGVRYRIAVVERRGRRTLTEGTIDAPPIVFSALHDALECAIELTGVGWFEFALVEARRGKIEIVRPVSGVR